MNIAACQILRWKTINNKLPKAKLKGYCLAYLRNREDGYLEDSDRGREEKIINRILLTKAGRADQYAIMLENGEIEIPQQDSELTEDSDFGYEGLHYEDGEPIAEYYTALRIKPDLSKIKLSFEKQIKKWQQNTGLDVPSFEKQKKALSDFIMNKGEQLGEKEFYRLKKSDILSVDLFECLFAMDKEKIINIIDIPTDNRLVDIKLSRLNSLKAIDCPVSLDEDSGDIYVHGKKIGSVKVGTLPFQYLSFIISKYPSRIPYQDVANGLDTIDLKREQNSEASRLCSDWKRELLKQCKEISKYVVHKDGVRIVNLD